MDLLTDTTQQRRCLSCSKILHGRSDKKFCNDQCRNLFNNELNSFANSYMRSIDHHLRRNRRVLQQALGEKQFVVSHISGLHNMGFDLAYYTHTQTSRKGSVYHFCYEYGYLLLSNGQLRIVYKPAQEHPVFNGIVTTST
jgi:hypothetical protein